MGDFLRLTEIMQVMQWFALLFVLSTRKIKSK